MGKQPKIRIKDVLFSIDAEHQLLIEVEHPGNMIAFDDLKNEGTYYTSLFDTTTRNLFEGFIPFDAEPEHVCRITIPRIILKGFPELTAGNLMQLNEASKKHGWGIQLLVEKQKVKNDLKGGHRKGGLR